MLVNRQRLVDRLTRRITDGLKVEGPLYFASSPLRRKGWRIDPNRSTGITTYATARVAGGTIWISVSSAAARGIEISADGRDWVRLSSRVVPSPREAARQLGLGSKAVPYQRIRSKYPMGTRVRWRDGSRAKVVGYEGSRSVVVDHVSPEGKRERLPYPMSDLEYWERSGNITVSR